MNVREFTVSSLLHEALALLLACASAVAHGQANSIEAVDVSPSTGGRIIVKVTLKQPLVSPPAAFSVTNPPRIAFDFMNTANALGRNAQEVGEGDLRSLNVVQAGDRTRLVLNLARASGYDTQIDGRTLLITLQGAAAAASAAGVTTHFAEARPGDTRHALRDIDFRRGPAGEGRVVVDLSDSAVGIDLKLQGRTIVVDFINTVLPQNLRRRLDVTDFGTVVQTIDAFGQGTNTRVVIEPRGTWEHTAYQTDTRFVIEVKPQAEDAGRIARGGGSVINVASFVALVGAARGGTVSEYFSPGTVVQVAAIPEPGSVFDGWSGTFEAAEDTLTLAVDSGFVLYARFSGTLEILSDSLKVGSWREPYRDSLHATGGIGAYTWRVERLPRGLAMDSTGVIAGVPEHGWNGALNIVLTSGRYQQVGTVQLTINAPALSQQGIVDHMLGASPLAPEQAEYLDYVGNRNGRVDLGDFVVWRATFLHPYDQAGSVDPRSSQAPARRP